jgi:hypothetical protein
MLALTQLIFGHTLLLLKERRAVTAARTRPALSRQASCAGVSSYIPSSIPISSAWHRKGFRPACVQAFVAQLSVEALQASILSRLARLDLHQVDLSLDGPRLVKTRNRFGAILAANRL